jgi:hypothetical protein
MKTMLQKLDEKRRWIFKLKHKMIQIKINQKWNIFAESNFIVILWIWRNSSCRFFWSKKWKYLFQNIEFEFKISAKLYFNVHVMDSIFFDFCQIQLGFIKSMIISDFSVKNMCLESNHITIFGMQNVVAYHFLIIWWRLSIIIIASHIFLFES